MMWPVLDLFLGGKIRHRTHQYLKDLSEEPVRASCKQATRLLKDFRSASNAQTVIGKTDWGETVRVPVSEMIAAHSLITGGTGAGKTRFALILIKSLIETLPDSGFGVLDPKGELFFGTQLLLSQRLNDLAKVDSEAARKLKDRVVILDFSCRDPISSYNIMVRSPTRDADFFAGSRSDLLLDLLPSGDGISLGGSTLLRKSILLLSEFGLPITWLDDVLHDGALRSRLLERSKNEDVRAYFTRQFASAPKQTVAALSRRMDGLFTSEGVRLALAGTKMPDFRALQDEGKIVLVNCFGANISRSVRQLLQALVLSDIAQSVFSRQAKKVCFPWFCDEGQNFFLTPRLRDHMYELLTMSRSFGTFMCCLTQNLGSAVQDSRLLHSLETNIRWSFSMRGEPGDCAFLRSALPVTGRRLQPQTDPFKEAAFFSLNDERTIELNAIGSLPDRTGYLWFRPKSSEAIRVTTADLTLPSGTSAGLAIGRLQRDATFGMRTSRNEYEQRIAERNQVWREIPSRADLGQTLAESYRQIRGREP